MRVAVVRFPASNCDMDAVTSLKRVKGAEPQLVWHEDPSLADYDAVILPGGFSFGDSLRAGAIAARSPAISAVREMAGRGLPVLGICNGFQVLVEAELLPGALLRNAGLKFVCKWVSVAVENPDTPFTRKIAKGSVLRMPIAHGEGRFYLQERELRSLEKSGRVVFRYTDENGVASRSANPTGTADNIAGISNREGNVVGLMPHPERASDPLLSPFHSSDGMMVFASLVGGGS
ncbi:MAG: phosphoribosylformylglycinamidine synthase I [Nitrososphaerota archaeon]|nr:phosphoribosylformylglycinamidine synthase I [Nitrososphaerota archaeon]